MLSSAAIIIIASSLTSRRPAGLFARPTRNNGPATSVRRPCLMACEPCELPSCVSPPCLSPAGSLFLPVGHKARELERQRPREPESYSQAGLKQQQVSPTRDNAKTRARARAKRHGDKQLANKCPNEWAACVPVLSGRVLLEAARFWGDKKGPRSAEAANCKLKAANCKLQGGGTRTGRPTFRQLRPLATTVAKQSWAKFILGKHTVKTVYKHSCASGAQTKEDSTDRISAASGPARLKRPAQS